MLNNTLNQPPKFRTKNWIAINDDSRETYDTNSQIKLKTSILKSILSDYRDAYLLADGTVAITEAGADDQAKWLDERNKGVILKYRALVTDTSLNYSNPGLKLQEKLLLLIVQRMLK